MDANTVKKKGVSNWVKALAVIAILIIVMGIMGPGSVCGIYTPIIDQADQKNFAIHPEDNTIVLNGDGTIEDHSRLFGTRHGTYKFDKSRKILYTYFDDGQGPESIPIIDETFSWKLDWGNGYEQTQQFHGETPPLLNNTKNTSSNSNDIPQSQNSQEQVASDTTVIGNSFADEPSSSTNDLDNSKSSPQSESSEDGAAKHDLSSIPCCYALRYHKYEPATTVLYLRKDGTVIYVIHNSSQGSDIQMLHGTYEVNGTDIFVVDDIGSFHVHKQPDGNLRSEDGLTLEQDYSY